jgi:hypothetical protein
MQGNVNCNASQRELYRIAQCNPVPSNRNALQSSNGLQCIPSPRACVRFDEASGATHPLKPRQGVPTETCLSKAETSSRIGASSVSS